MNASEKNGYQDIDIAMIPDSFVSNSHTAQAVSVVFNYISTLDVKSLYEDIWTDHLSNAASHFLCRSKKGSAAVSNPMDSSPPALRETKAPAHTSGIENEIPGTPDVSVQSPREASLAGRQSEEDESQCRSHSHRSSSMSASSGDASGESEIFESHDETDTSV